jgi:hypothetical protein
MTQQPLADSYTAAIRKLISEALTDPELTTLCFDHFRPAFEDFSAGQTRTAKIQVLIEHCDRHNLFSQLLKEIQKLNPPRYREFISIQAHAVIGLQVDQIPEVDLSVQAVQQEYDAAQRAMRPVDEARVEVLDFQFRDRKKNCRQILQSDANHIELYGSSGVGKTYLLLHVAESREDVRTVYIDLGLHPTVNEILPEAVGQLGGTSQPQPSAGPVDLALAIKNLYEQSLKHFLFLFDSATEEHQAVIDWLIGREGLINSQQFLAALPAMGIRVDNVKLQVVIAARRPVVKVASYHPNFHFDRFQVDRLKKDPDPKEDPIQGMLQELADRGGIPIDQDHRQKISDEVYYLTGGHPKCAKSMLFAVADLRFVVAPEQWKERWKTFFKMRVLPTIQGEMLGSIPNPDLFPVFWVLSAFRRFDQRLLGTLLERRILPSTIGGPDSALRARRLRKQLLDTYLISEPTIGESMYTMNYTVRRVLSLSMRYHFPERYRAVNSAALDIFTNWLQSARTGPERAIMSLIEIVYHWFNALAMDPKVDEKDICARIQEALQEYLPLLLTAVEEDEWPACLPRLRDHWKEDKEIQETAQRATGERQCYERLSRQIERFINDNLYKPV